MDTYVAASELASIPVTPRRHLGCDEIVVSAFPGNYKTKRIQLTAAMAGVSVEFVDAREVQFVPCAVQKYPMARVIEHGGPSRREWFIFTTPAICRYIARLRRDCSLLGIGSEVEAAVDSTMDFITQELEVPIALLIYWSSGAISPSKMVAKRASWEIEGALKQMNHLLREEGSHGFLVPGTTSISLADIFAITVLSEGISHDLVTIDETDCPQVTLWLDRMAQSPLVQKFVFGQFDSFRTAPGLAVDASALSSASEREGQKAGDTPRRSTARTVPPVDIPRVAFGGRNDDAIKLSGRQDDPGVVASKVRRWEGKVSGSSTAAPACPVAKKAPPFPSEGGAQRPASSPVASGGSGNRMSTSRDLDDSKSRPLAGGSGAAVEESLKVTKSARGRLEGGQRSLREWLRLRLSYPCRSGEGPKGALNFLLLMSIYKTLMSRHIISPTELWPQGDDQTVVAELRGEDQETAVMGEAYSNPNSDFVEEKSSGRDLPDSNASQGPSEAAEHPVGKLQEHEECDRGHLEPEGRTGEEQDAASFIDQRLIKMMTEGQHFGRNSDRRRLPTAGRFGTLSLKMEADSPTVAERAMWSAPVPPPEAERGTAASHGQSREQGGVESSAGSYSSGAGPSDCSTLL
ncbi:Elongation factor 1-gamma [Perkinsus olseni]|uniref:Elongation factor 1-gamma n=1 Tax=Perkinsus olseni TaxID=32597 RepID=A0A7J6P222_PEROL|nr:Elongation factor 1-gamma [Perkinsus olseni]